MRRYGHSSGLLIRTDVSQAMDDKRLRDSMQQIKWLFYFAVAAVVIAIVKVLVLG